MKLEYIIKNLIQNNKIKTQNELTQILLDKGINTTQSNISRILKKLNTVKIVDENKETYYIIHSRPLEIVDWTKNLILNIDNNGYNIVIKTYAGSANLIARIIEERNMNDILATIAGYNNIIIVPKDVKEISALTTELKKMFFLE